MFIFCFHYSVDRFIILVLDQLIIDTNQSPSQTSLTLTLTLTLSNLTMGFHNWCNQSIFLAKRRKFGYTLRYCWIPLQIILKDWLNFINKEQKLYVLRKYFIYFLNKCSILNIFSSVQRPQ